MRHEQGWNILGLVSIVSVAMIISIYYNSLSRSLYRFTYRPFHKTLPRSSAFCKWISVRFYETGCIQCSHRESPEVQCTCFHILYRVFLEVLGAQKVCFTKAGWIRLYNEFSNNSLSSAVSRLFRPQLYSYMGKIVVLYCVRHFGFVYESLLMYCAVQEQSCILQYSQASLSFESYEQLYFSLSSNFNK